MAGILRNFQPALENVFLKIKKTCIKEKIAKAMRGIGIIKKLNKVLRRKSLITIYKSF